MGALLERRLRNDFAALALVAREVRSHLRLHGAGARTTHAVDLALEELVSNTIRHGYDDGGAHEILVRVAVTADGVELAIEDDGRAFDPTRAPEPPPATSLEDTRVGGRGIQMVRRLVGEMRYRREGERNVVTLRVRD